MDPARLVVQPVVRLKAESLGAPGRAWLKTLPDQVTELERRWSIVAEDSFTGGTAAFVADARTLDGTRVVLKIIVPDPHFTDEIGTLVRAAGRGYVRLLAHDAGRRAMLLEALGPSMGRTGLTPEEQLATLCRLLRQAWDVPRAGTGPMAVAMDKATSLATLVTSLWERLDGPCSARARAQALRFAERRAAAFNPGGCVLVHGDAAPANALRVLADRPGAETGFVFVDPDGFVGDPAYDLGVALRDWCPEILSAADPMTQTRGYCRLLASASGLDEQAIWEWGYLERVSTGLYATAMGAHELGRPFLDTAEMLL
jgi:streptomycin 6-kinase